MFHKKKPSTPVETQPVLRSRTRPGQDEGTKRRGGDNPLARRFQVDAEPATVDLAGPARFPADKMDDADPKTAPLQTDASKLGRIISHDLDTGKFYIHPGNADLPVTLQGEPVVAPTELRSGDIIRIADTEIHFGAVV